MDRGWAPRRVLRTGAADRDAAVQISVHVRDVRKLDDNEAANLLVTFLTKVLKSPGGEIRVSEDGPREQRAFSNLTVPDDAGNPIQWFAACILWPTHMLMCTFNSAPVHRDFKAAERKLASSISPRLNRPLQTVERPRSFGDDRNGRQSRSVGRVKAVERRPRTTGNGRRHLAKGQVRATSRTLCRNRPDA